MQHMILIYSDESVESQMSQDDWQTLLEAHNQFGVKYKGKVKGGDALDPTNTAKTIRLSGGAKTVVDGPFAETKEQLGGYYLVDVDSIDEAVAMAKDLPLAEHSSIEVRPVMDMSDKS